MHTTNPKPGQRATSFSHHCCKMLHRPPARRTSASLLVCVAGRRRTGLAGDVLTVTVRITYKWSGAWAERRKSGTEGREWADTANQNQQAARAKKHWPRGPLISRNTIGSYYPNELSYFLVVRGGMRERRLCRDLLMICACILL